MAHCCGQLSHCSRQVGRRSPAERRRAAGTAVVWRVRAINPCPLLAQSGHAVVHCTCLLSGVKRTSLLRMYAATRGILSEIFLNPISKNGELFLPIVSYR